VNQPKRPVVLITGASAGIGAALAHEFAAHGHELVLVARREQALGATADAIARRGHARPVVLPVDLERPEAAELIGTHLIVLGLEPEVVVNNAGFGLLGAARALDRAAQLAMIDLNVRVLTELSLAFVESTTPPRPSCFPSAKRCTMSSSPGACG
jgi:short-subunit dehydrogenase